MQQIKPVYVDVHGREIATVKIHVNNGSDVAFVLDGHFALTSMESAENFFSSLDFEAAGLSSTALLYKGDNKNADQYAGEIFFNKQYRNYGIGLLIVDYEKFKDSGLPLYGWDGDLIKFAA